MLPFTQPSFTEVEKIWSLPCQQSPSQQLFLLLGLKQGIFYIISHADDREIAKLTEILPVRTKLGN